MQTTDTSAAAHAAIQPEAENLREQVLAVIEAAGAYGATDEEVQTALGMRVQTETPRRYELRKAGMVRDSGARRPTSSGRKAIVWVFVPEGERTAVEQATA